MTLRSILIFRNGSIGNTLMAVPAIKSIRRSFPDARIHVVVDPIGFELLEHCPYVDSLLIYDKQRRHRGLVGFINTARRLRVLKPDSAILFKRFFRNGLLAFLSGAKIRVGFSTNGTAPFLTRTIPYDEHMHVADLDLQLAEFIGADIADARDPEIFLSDEDLLRGARLRESFSLRNRDYIVVHHGGATSGGAHVSPQLLSDLLARVREGKQVLFVGSGQSETALAKSLCEMIPKSHALTSLPLRTTSSLIKECYAFIGMNSGPTHIAAACQVPALALFRDDDSFPVESVKWAPRSRIMRVIPVAKNLDIASREAVLASAQQAWSEVTTLRTAS